MPPSKISIIGAGISSLVLARTLLKNHRIKTCIFEKAQKSTQRNNYGITLYEESYKHLLDLFDIDRKALERKIGIFPAKRKESELGKGMRVNRGRLERLLMQEIEEDISFETELDSFKPSTGSNNAHFKPSSGSTSTTTHSSDILIAADGVHSPIRQKILPETTVKILPFATYNGKRKLSTQEWQAMTTFFENETVLEHRIGPTLFQISLCHTPPPPPPPPSAASTSSSSSSPQEEREDPYLSYTFSRPALPPSQPDPLFRPQRSKSEATALPPEAFFSELEIHHSKLPEPFSQIFEPSIVRKDRLLNWLQRSLHVDFERLKSGADEGVVLIGDAGHAEPILGGRGANGAILDAVVLAGVIGEGKRLGEFYERRSEAWERGVREAEERIGEMHRERARRNDWD